MSKMSMSNRSSVFVVVALLILLAMLGLHQWMVVSENSLLTHETGQSREVMGKLRREKEELHSQLTELRMTLDDRKRYISDIDGKFLKANADLESKSSALQRCVEETKKVGEGAVKQKKELETKEDERKKMEEEKKKVESNLKEFKKLCTVVDMNKDLAKKLCPKSEIQVKP